MGFFDRLLRSSSAFNSDNSPADAQTVVDRNSSISIEKAVALVNPTIKLVPAYRDVLSPGIEKSAAYFQTMAQSMPPPIRLSANNWFQDPQLRAFFAASGDIPLVLGRSESVRALLAKNPKQEEAWLILDMNIVFSQAQGLSLQDPSRKHDLFQHILSFSGHRVRLCGTSEKAVRQLFQEKGFDYLVSQSLPAINEQRALRQKQEEERRVMNAQRRLFEQAAATVAKEEQSAKDGKSDSKPQSPFRQTAREEDDAPEFLQNANQRILEAELHHLSETLLHPETYLSMTHEEKRLSKMNVLVDPSSQEDAATIHFALANLLGVPRLQKAFVIACFSRSEMPAATMNLDDAARYL